MQKLRWVGCCFVLAALGCSQTNAREGVDAAVDTREASRDVMLNVDGDAPMEVTRESLCMGLDPLSQACAREALARIDRDACQDQVACWPSLDPRYCDVYYPEQGAWFTEQNRRQLVLVRLGRLRIDLDAVICELRGNRYCSGDGVNRCGPIFVPTAEFTSCTQQEECDRASYCALPDPPSCGGGVCTPRLAPGATCGVGAQCAWGEQCLEALCRAFGGVSRADLGESCGDFVDGATYRVAQCEPGFGCLIRPPSTCVRLSRLGEPCGDCDVGLECRDNLCVDDELPREGDPCESPSGFQPLCAWGTFGLLCEDGVCVTSEGRIGDVCRLPCVEGHCAFSIDVPGPSRCMATRLPLGAFCNAVDQCENGLCCDGVCVPLPE